MPQQPAPQHDIDPENADELRGEFTELMATIGVEDTQVDVAKTATMRPPTVRASSGAHRQVGQLPRLMEAPGEGDDAARQTLPELRVKGVIGEGGMGLVELAEQVALGRDVAVKKVREAAKSDEARVVLLREGWTTGLLEHPNIIPVYTLGRNDEGEPVIVMKRVEGTPWMDIIGDPSLAPAAFEHADEVDLHVEILSQVCNAVHFAHSRDIIHRDIKPENIMLGEFGEVYLLDWGIAVSLDDDPQGRLMAASDVTTPAGTPAYMAPEMVDGDGAKLSGRTDVYLLGATLYEALSGEAPHRGDSLYQIMFAAYQSNIRDLPSDVPPELAAICRRAMEREPDERFASAEDLRQALVEYREKRESRRLSEKGDISLDALEELVSREKDGADVDEAAIYRVFGECRFAYEQALEVAGDNERARDGLQDALELMAERELEHRAHKAAALLIADLPRANPELEERLDQLADQLQSREEEFEHLQKIRHETDTEVGRASRSIFALVMGLIWGGLTFGIGVGIDAGWLTINHAFVMVHIVLLNVILAVILWAGREKLFQNEVNKRMLLSVQAMFVIAAFMRGAVWAADLSSTVGLALEMTLYGAAGSAVAVALDLRILWASVPFAIAGVVAAWMPDQVFTAFGITNLTSMCALAIAWWPRKQC
ncbi:MAG: serine/threonine-protein kinase [Myxococcota bacterium]